jgi:dipeptidyl aminopeptidase/acylaminoacyl peptidase
MRSYIDITYGKLNAPLQKLDIHLPDGDGPFPIIVYFHGGGLEEGDKSNRRTCESLVKLGVGIATVNYRMYPDAKYPEFIEDAAEAVAWVYENIGKYCKYNGIYVGGSSAGGYLSMMLCFDKQWLSKYGISPTDITGFIHNAGQPTAHFNVLKYKGIDPKRVIVDETAPLYHIGVDEKYPPMMFLVADHDMENRYEQTLLTVSTLKHFGHTEPIIKFKVVPGKHTSYGVDENGITVLAKLIAEFINAQ